ncbi:FGGY-family carbohydrate kinase, partial [Kineococcus aurantiacus]|uniref:FGGY-family carbohydrate kinase n=1 Tax=Kineococcus aurantiacus TaxID=37633 RepID=UPI0031DDB094
MQMLTDAGGAPLRGATSGSLVLAVDQGTSATKAIAVDDAGAVAARSTQAMEQHFPRPGWAEQDAEELWASVQRAVADCLTQVDATRVVALALSTQRESTLVWDRASGRPLGPILSWQDTRGARLCTQLHDGGHADKIRNLTGLPLDAMFSASKASALLDAHDLDRSRSRTGQLCLGTVDSWLIWKLTGAHLIEAGNAGRTQLLDITTRRWDPWLLELFNVPLQVLPQVTASTGPFPTVKGLHPDLAAVPLTGVLGDSHAALFAHAGWQPGRVKVTYGTGSSVMGVAPSEQHPHPGIARTIAWEIDQPCYALEGNIRSSGATLVWLSRLLGVSVAEIAARAANTTGGVTLVPAFTGLGAPWWDDRAQGLISGLSETTRVEHLARAALESIAHQIEDVVAAVEGTAGAIEVLLADGGPSTNATLMQLQADTSGRRVEVSEVSELSALGAAHLAGIGAGLWSLQDLQERPVVRTLYQPEESAVSRGQRQQSWHTAITAACSIPRAVPHDTPHAVPHDTPHAVPHDTPHAVPHDT